jgi:uracil-DNA glycosylase
MLLLTARAKRMEAIMPKISNDWMDVIGDEFEKPYYLELRRFLIDEYRTRRIYPAADDIFNAFHFTPLKNVKVLLIGQDPYHNERQAIGASFAVPPDQREIPPSLANIYRELRDDLGCRVPNNGYLKKWADQGVLLLNSVLTVRAHMANSHRGMGWETFTDAVIRAVNGLDRPVAYFLWGNPAREKKRMLNNPGHLILEAPHPSPLSAHRGFFGCGHFSKANAFLAENGVEPIDWQIEDIDAG